MCAMKHCRLCSVKLLVFSCSAMSCSAMAMFSTTSMMMSVLVRLSGVTEPRELSTLCTLGIMSPTVE